MKRQILAFMVLLISGMPASVSATYIQVGGGLASGGGTSTSLSYDQFGTIGTVSSGEETASTNYRNAGGLIRTVAATTTVLLTLRLDGSGGGSVNDGAGFFCTAGSPGVPTACAPRTYQPGQTVTLMPTPDGGSFFSGWSGACTGLHPLDPDNLNCRIVMNGDRSVTASFEKPKPVLIRRLANAYFDTLSLAYAVVQPGEEILLVEGVLADSPVFGRAVSIKIRGGFDPLFGSGIGAYTAIDGSLKIRQGTVRAERIRVR